MSGLKSVPTKKPGKPPKKYSQAARLVDVIRILKARYGATVDELAEECKVSRRTVYRDLEAIEEAGYPLTSETQPDGTVLHRFISEFKEIPPITFSLQELMTLYLCRGQLSFLRGTPFQDDLHAIFGRIRSSLPPRSVAHLERLASTSAPLFQGQRDYGQQRAILEALREALLKQVRCRIIYAPPKRQAEEYLFDPYTLIFFQNSLYLGGWAHNRDGLRLFLVDRVQKVDLCKERFEVPEDFRADDLTGSGFGLVHEQAMPIRVRFGPEIAYLIQERVWHPTQVVDLQADGSLVLDFQAGGKREILAWLYSFIPHVEVLEPESLRREFAEGLRQAADRCAAPAG